MPEEKTQKSSWRLEPKFERIVTEKNGGESPYLEVFVFEGENISQKNLGVIAGILEITDKSEESSYIVNYIISVIKKEYFKNTKRGAIESFEASLHKANLALSGLAEHGSINWIGNLHAAITVIEKNTILFSSSGNVRTFILRSQNLLDLSEEKAETSPNPLKTFQDVVSGRIEKNDKVILASNSVFEIFSKEEIEKSALKFSRDEFARFMKTALINELERAAVLIVDVDKKEILPNSADPKNSENINAFSQAAFSEKKKIKKSKEESPSLQDKERQKIIQGIKDEYEKTKGEFVDKKTGHIYIKEDPFSQKEESSASLGSYGQKIISGGGNIFSSMKEKTKLKNTQKNEREEIHIKIKEETDPSKILTKPAIFLKSLSGKISPLLLMAGKFFTTNRTFFSQKIFLPAKNSGMDFFKKTFAKREFLKEKFRREKKDNEQTEIAKFSNKNKGDESYLSRSVSREEKRSWFSQLSQKNRGNERPNISQNDYPKNNSGSSESTLHENFSGKKILPSFSRIKSSYASLNPSKKAAAIGILSLIFIAPYFAARLPKKEDVPQPEENPIVLGEKTIALESDKNVIRLENITVIDSKNVSLGIINLNGKIFFAGENEIFSLEDKASYPLPENFQGPDLAFGMDDLNLIFFLKNGRLVSWSAVSGKFQDNNIDIPSEAKIVSGKAYLTYAYFLDKNSSQIYRYPRAEGGFGQRSDWIKEDLDLSGAADLTINENIFIIENGKILKFFQGKIQEFETEQSATPIEADKIYARSGSENIYALDKTNSRIVKFQENGKIDSQYHHPSFQNASCFSADEEKNIVYVSSENGVGSFEMNQ